MFIASDLLPYLVGEIPGFQSLLKVPDPHYKIPFGPHFYPEVNTLHNEAQNQTVNKLPKASCFLNTFCWSYKLFFVFFVLVFFKWSYYYQLKVDSFPKTAHLCVLFLLYQSDLSTNTIFHLLKIDMSFCLTDFLSDKKTSLSCYWETQKNNVVCPEILNKCLLTEISP